MLVDTFELESRMRTWLRQRPGKLFGIVDSAATPHLAIIGREQCKLTMTSLFEGSSAKDLYDVAPYLFRLDLRTSFLSYWIDCLGENAGFLFTSSASFDQLLAHARDLFHAKDEHGKSFFFRFYDPRVLRTYLTTLTAQEISTIWKPMDALLIETKTKDGFHRVGIHGGDYDDLIDIDFTEEAESW